MDQIYKGDHISGEIEIEGTDTVFENRYITIFNDHVIFPKGNKGTYVRLKSACDGGVAILPITEDGKIIVVNSFRHALRAWCYEIPKGGIEFGEDPETGAKRELLEETGYESDQYIYLGEYSENPAVYSNTIKCYAAIGCRKAFEAAAEDTEAIQGIHVVTVEELKEMNKSMAYVDTMTELLIYKYKEIMEGRD